MPKNSPSSGRNSPSVRRNQEPLVAAQGEHVSARFGRGDFGSTLWFAGLTCAFIAYFCWYLSQPSFFAAAFDPAEGADHSRFIDLFLFPASAAQTFLFFPGGLDRLPYILLGFSWLSAAAWIGWPLVRCIVPVVWYGPEASTRAARLVAASLSVLVGLSLLSTMVLMIGLAGGLGSRAVLLLSLASLLVIADRIRRFGPKPSAAEDDELAGEEFEPDSIGMVWSCRLAALVTVGMAIFYVLGSLVPAWEFDVLEYHLQAPKEFYQSGCIDFVPHNVYANMPLGVEMHSLAMMVLWGSDVGWWHGGIAGKLIIGIHALLAAALVGGFVTKRHGLHLGWFCAALIFTMPGNAHVSFAGLIDTALGAYVLAALMCFFFLWRSKEETTSIQTRLCQALAIGCLSGAACACKYPGLLFAVFPAAAMLLWSIWRAEWKAGVVIGGFALGLLMTCAPWFARNAVQSQNPVFPVAHSVFGGRGLTKDQAERWSNVHSPSAKAEIPPFSLAAIQRDLKQVAVGSPFTNLALNFFAILSIGALVQQYRRSANLSADWLWLIFVIWIFGLWWLVTHRIDRFWLPAVPFIAILASKGAMWTARVSSSSLAIFAMSLWICVGGLAVLAGIGPTDCRIFVPLAQFERETLEETPDGAVNPTMAWINRNLSAEDNLLCIGEVKAFLYRVPIIYSTCFNDAPGESWLRDQASEKQRENLHANGVTHVMVDWYEIERYRSPGNYGFSDWPVQSDFKAMVEAGVLRPMQHPFPTDRVEIFEVVRE